MIVEISLLPIGTQRKETSFKIRLQVKETTFLWSHDLRMHSDKVVTLHMWL